MELVGAPRHARRAYRPDRARAAPARHGADGRGAEPGRADRVALPAHPPRSAQPAPRGGGGAADARPAGTVRRVLLQLPGPDAGRRLPRADAGGGDRRRRGVAAAPTRGRGARHPLAAADRAHRRVLRLVVARIRAPARAARRHAEPGRRRRRGRAGVARLAPAAPGTLRGGQPPLDHGAAAPRGVA